MLQAPTTESKQQNDVARRAQLPEPQRTLHPRFSDVYGRDRTRPLGPKADTAQLRQQVSGLQRTVGNQAVLRMLARAPAIQTKLTINQPGDRYEQEAARAAEQVMRICAAGRFLLLLTNEHWELLTGPACA